ncbi:MAG: nucleotidyltransferase domain-containing protein [Actinomycetota bacterium]|jgi:predicted nucleotidyltransferase|nr:nucleotidyltransferase domain-containing protein [Rubrobacter sp.]MDQ3509321.1 nucleotidyltransferase domain-containing protein [Actinomycetota bacterium]
MLRFTDKKRQKIEEACERHAVSRLDLFGSATSEFFDPDRSDLDFVVSFAPRSPANLFDRYFGLKEDLSRVFDREVDVVMEGAIRNTHFAKSVSESRTPLYAA